MEKKRLTISKGRHTVVIPYFTFGRSKGTGDIFITAGIHGDEVNGIHGVNRIMQWFNRSEITKKLNGKVLVFPVLNPHGFQSGTRTVPEDTKDLNRQFGLRKGSLSTLMATTLTEVLSQCAMGIDLHDAGYGAQFIPHARIHLSDEDDCVSCSRSLAQVFGTEFILEREGQRNMMAVYLNDKHNTPVITVETGGSQIIHHDAAQIILRGVKNVLVGNRFLDGEMEMPTKQYVVRHRDIVQTKHAGIIRFEVGLGSTVTKGDLVASIYDPVGSTTLPITAPKDGVIFSIWPTNLIRVGQTMFSVVCMDKRESEDVIEMENYVVKPFDL
ncbi:DUF2817 domain-containing protein [Candidatus Nomurabacteria bacterium]|nr:DUF2817 domain-containing protein [Candidatus Nomurabacteria bacterium]MCB9803581.1 DUF2817 domain-containing protein [Candidatus Nomurabacteria bacterium]